MREIDPAASRSPAAATVDPMFRTIMERIRHRREIKRIARSHRHGGRGAGSGTTAMDTDSAAKARGAGETIGRQGGYGAG